MLYWLESSHKDYEDIEITTYLTLEDALVEYNAIIQEMMKVLPKSEWFDLRLMRPGKTGDFMPSRNQVVRSWVY